MLFGEWAAASMSFARSAFHWRSTSGSMGLQFTHMPYLGWVRGRANANRGGVMQIGAGVMHIGAGVMHIGAGVMHIGVG